MPKAKRKNLKLPKNDAPQIQCAYDKFVATAELKPNPRNPNLHSEEQVRRLSELIRHHGWRHPITVSNRSGFVVAGHCRLAVAKLLKLDTVPVDYQDFASEAEEQAVLIADNVIAEESEMDFGLLDDLLKDDLVKYLTGVKYYNTDTRLVDRPVMKQKAEKQLF